MANIYGSTNIIQYRQVKLTSKNNELRQLVKDMMVALEESNIALSALSDNPKYGRASIIRANENAALIDMAEKVIGNDK